mmetsp:Transcript_46986/g.111855  ORF Transcript_46986/g.111855 Transcript_46986/m.111855 type:complete len:107 (+) Transcript_46986:100-420(+)|eukprot:CAMPEP_0178400910 /NCGR_PEP_ID=MMETSP0689_2-20121128/16031_1 /TAXON_ID=160604 /ORGANISM="Amphidinium massartii, Strain CS-259" /LENGTH=106 /DNA_ID=CAMNT_0020021717 /DNA_START=99 /DNA_END=419 /DNA_ORIENTATION=+
MARAPLRSALLLVAAAVFTLQSAFVSGPVASQRAATTAPQDLLSAATVAGVSALGAAPAFAEELPPDEIYNRKVLEAGSYVLIFSAFLVGLVIYQARKLVENKWLN